MGTRIDRYQQWVRDGVVKEKIALIRSLSMQGESVPNIAAAMGLGERQFERLMKWYDDVGKAVRYGREVVVAQLQNELMKKAQGGDTTAIIYALKVYGGEFFNDRKFTQRTELTGKDGGPIEETQKVVFYLPQKDPGPDEDDEQ